MQELKEALEGLHRKQDFRTAVESLALKLEEKARTIGENMADVPQAEAEEMLRIVDRKTVWLHKWSMLQHSWWSPR